MEPILVGLMTVLVITAVLLVAFFLTVHPIWAIIDVATSTRASNAEKALWIIFCFLTWSIASFIYGLAFASRPLAVTTRIFAIGLVVIVCIGGALMIFAPAAARLSITRP